MDIGIGFTELEQSLGFDFEHVLCLELTAQYSHNLSPKLRQGAILVEFNVLFGMCNGEFVYAGSHAGNAGPAGGVPVKAGE